MEQKEQREVVVFVSWEYWQALDNLIKSNQQSKNTIMEKNTTDSQRQLTDGEKAVGITFNPGGSDLVNSIKQKFAAVIDELNDERSKVTGNAARYYSKAISYAEDAQMNAVQAATWQY